jgi:hypothetical protein
VVCHAGGEPVLAAERQQRGEADQRRDEQHRGQRAEDEGVVADPQVRIRA